MPYENQRRDFNVLYDRLKEQLRDKPPPRSGPAPGPRPAPPPPPPAVPPALRRAAVPSVAAGMLRDPGRLDDPARVEALRREVDGALAASHAIEEALRAALRELEHAPAAYAAAASFRARAGDYGDEGFRAACLSWADRYEGLAVRCPAERERAARFLAAVAQTTEFVRVTAMALDDYHLFLSTYAGGEVPTAVVDRHAAALADYVGRFTAFERESAAFGARPGLLDALTP